MNENGFDPAASYDPSVCCYCGATAYSRVISGPTVPILACAKCGLMRRGWLSRPTMSGIDYAAGEARFLRQTIEKQEAQLKDFLQISDRLLELLPNKGELLEIGCATGTTLNGFRQKGWRVTGIEPEQWTSGIARSKYGLNVISAPFQEAGLITEAFDVVMLLHVIEHLADPFRALCDIAKLLRPAGYLVLETPRYDTFAFRILRGRERSVIPDHLHYFTRSSMLAMCRDAGYRACRVEAVGRTLTLDKLCFYLAKFTGSRQATKWIAGFSDYLHLNEIRVHINLHDMMRLYLQKQN